MTAPVALDASAVLAFLGREEGWEYVDPLLDGGLVSAVNLGEVLCKAAQDGSDPTGTAEDLIGYGLRVVPFTAAHAARLPALREADRLARNGDRPVRRKAGRRSLSLADLCCLALAWESGAAAVTGDRHWLGLDLPVTVVDYRDPPRG